MLTAGAPILDSFSALADATRCRMLAVLEEQELTVTEICAVLQLPQSTVSRHLKTLAEAGWVSSRRDGTSRYYAHSTAGDPARAQIWQLTRDQLTAAPGARQDARRLADILARRRETSQQFFATAAGQWDRLRDDLFGADVGLRALVGLMPAGWVVGDLGCGTGALVTSLAPVVGRVIGVDASEEMLSSARVRAGGFTNVEWRRGALESLPLPSSSLDAATMMLVLHHVPSPTSALSEAARVLVPGGRLLIVDMTPHDREEYRTQMGHVWLGFSDDQVRRLLGAAGFTDVRIHPLPPAHGAKGPTLFAAVATSPGPAPTGDGPARRPT